MKCAVCGKEFGEGVNCQSCGTDRVTGLANYSGYNNHGNNSDYNSSNKMEYVSNRTTVCYACGEIIPSDAEYCPYCRKKLYNSCPKCGKEYSSQFENCPKCGTNRHDYYLKQETKKQEEKRREKEESKLKNEASKLRNELEGHGHTLMIWWFFWMILLVLGSSLTEEIKNGVILVSIMGVGLFVAIIGNCIIIDLPKRKIEKWKQEHPNDPRCKYL